MNTAISNTAPARGGFTLAEMMISTAIMVVAITLAMTGYLYIWSETNKSGTQDELDVQVQLSIEKIKRDLRLSALEKIFYYPPGAGPYSAISMPLARDDDGDGAVDLDGSGKIIWDQTVIYHVWSGNPSQLRKTVFDPRDSSLTTTQMQSQLNSVAIVGNGSQTYGATNSTTDVIFQNLFAWSVQPQSSTYDGYAATLQRDLNEVIGSAVMSNGAHTLKFNVYGKQAAASGYRMGIDSLFLSPSASPREAEAKLPATAVVGAVTPTNVYMSAGSWSGNYQLSFPATAVGQSFTLTLNNDRWEETNFRATGESHDETTVLFDTSLSPYDFVVPLDANITSTDAWNWWASTQTRDAVGGQSVSDNVKGYAIRVLMRGRDVNEGNAIAYTGGKCYVLFRAGSMGNFIVTDVFIAEAVVSGGEVSPDAVPGTVTRLKFPGGANGATIASGGTYTDQAAFSIDKDKSYLITYLVNGTAGNGNAWRWVSTNATYTSQYVINATNAPTAATAADAVWSTRSDVYATNSIHGIWATWVTYPTNGLYTSAIFDTQNEAPAYSNISWNAVVPSGAYVGLKVRTSTNSTMSDAANWTNITAITTSGSSINPGNKRYVQFQATLRPPAAGTSTPKLRDVTINWPGVTKVVDIGGTFTKGPDYGIFELLVDGQPLKKGVVVNLEIYDYTRAHGTSNRITSAATAEVTPRNTGR